LAADAAQEVAASRFGLEELLIQIFGNLEIAIDPAAAEAQV
jgi:hypothetical protein